MRNLAFFVALALSLLLVGCESYDFSQRVVEQGNLLPQSKIEQLKVGMSKEKVTALMGTSLITPTFNSNRWDYAYTWRKGLGNMSQRYVSLYFQNDRLIKIEHSPVS